MKGKALRKHKSCSHTISTHCKGIDVIFVLKQNFSVSIINLTMYNHFDDIQITPLTII